jgi:hypothetical protein
VAPENPIKSINYDDGRTAGSAIIILCPRRVHKLRPHLKLDGTHLQIQDVSVNFSIKKITILEQMFDFGPGPLTVSLANVGDLTPDCTPNFAVTPQTITCDLSGGTPPFLGAGDYLLTVSNGNAPARSTYTISRLARLVR